MSTVDFLSTVPGFASMDRAALEALAGQVHTATWESEQATRASSVDGVVL